MTSRSSPIPTTSIPTGNATATWPSAPDPTAAPDPNLARLNLRVALEGISCCAGYLRLQGFPHLSPFDVQPAAAVRADYLLPRTTGRDGDVNASALGRGPITSSGTPPTSTICCPRLAPTSTLHPRPHVAATSARSPAVISTADSRVVTRYAGRAPGRPGLADLLSSAHGGFRPGDQHGRLSHLRPRSPLQRTFKWLIKAHLTRAVVAGYENSLGAPDRHLHRGWLPRLHDRVRSTFPGCRLLRVRASRPIRPGRRDQLISPAWSFRAHPVPDARARRGSP